MYSMINMCPPASRISKSKDDKLAINFGWPMCICHAVSLIPYTVHKAVFMFCYLSIQLPEFDCQDHHELGQSETDSTSHGEGGYGQRPE